jgi:hypothetical protein
VWAADIEDIEFVELRDLENLDTVGRQELTGQTRGLAARVRLELVDLAGVVERA